MTEEAPVRFALVDINEILKTLPHRYPMLLIDRVIDIRTDYSGIGIKNVTFNEPCFLGHFPERPVYPGVMMIEAMAQTAGVIGIKSVEGTEKPRAVYFLTIDKCKFRKPVMPGDTIEYHMRSIGRRKTMWWFHGDADAGIVGADIDHAVDQQHRIAVRERLEDLVDVHELKPDRCLLHHSRPSPFGSAAASRTSRSTAMISRNHCLVGLAK